MTGRADFGCGGAPRATAAALSVNGRGDNGLPVDFFDTGALAATVVDCLAQPARHAPLRAAARHTVQTRYDLATICLPQQLRLVCGA